MLGSLPPVGSVGSLGLLCLAGGSCIQGGGEGEEVGSGVGGEVGGRGRPTKNGCHGSKAAGHPVIVATRSCTHPVTEATTRADANEATGMWRVRVWQFAARASKVHRAMGD